MNLFEHTKTAKLDREMLEKLPIHRLKAYRRKLFSVESRFGYCDCCGEPLQHLYPDDDHSKLEEVQAQIKMVNEVFAKRSRIENEQSR